MSKFKVGDKVRVKKGYRGYHFYDGEEFIIDRINDNNDYNEIWIYSSDKDKIYCYDYQVQLVESAKSTELVTKESSYTIKLSGYKKTITEQEAKQLRDELNTLLGE